RYPHRGVNGLRVSAVQERIDAVDHIVIWRHGPSVPRMRGTLGLALALNGDLVDAGLVGASIVRPQLGETDQQVAGVSRASRAELHVAAGVRGGGYPGQRGQGRLGPGAELKICT